MDPGKIRNEFILLVMSDEKLIIAFEKRLHEYGYLHIEMCSSGNEALKKLNASEIYLVITDVELKGDLDGIETGKRIRDEYDLPLIYLSGLQDETTFQKVLATQPLAFLSKPVNWNELRMAIESALFRNREKASMNAVIKDVTAQKRAEDALRESEKKFKNLIESAGDIIYLLDHDLNYVYANDQCLKRYGLTKEKLIGKNYRDFHSNESSDEFNERVRAVRKSGKPSIYEHQSKTDGKFFLRTLSPIIDPETEKIESITVISRDITERKKTEEAHRESEERFRIASQIATDVVYERDLQTGIATFYGDIDAHLGYESGEYPRTMEGWREHVHPEDLALIERQSLDKLEPGVPHGIEYRMRKKDGTYITWWDRIILIRDEKTGKPVKFIGVATDITERKQAEEELATVNDRLANNLKSMTRLHMLGTLLVSEDGMDVVLQEILDVAIAIANADMGNIQLLDRQSESLKIRAHRGFEQPFLDFWDSVLEGQGICGTALEQGERVIVEDISQSPIFVGSPALDVQLAAGVRAVLSTPLLGRSGKLIGMCSTHFRTPQRPDEQTLHLLDLHARQVGDIIERAQMEETLRESEQKLKEAQSIGRIGSWEFNVDHGTIEWSDETYRLYERDPALGPPTPEEEAGYYTSEQSSILREYARRAIENGEEFEYDLQVRLPGGRTAFFSASMHPVRDESGRIAKLFGTVQDITERKKIETDLQNSRQMLQLVLDTIPVGVFWKDRDLNYLGANRVFLNNAGMNTSEELTGKSDFDLPWMKEQADSFRDYDRKIIESGVPEFDITEPYIRIDGTSAWARTKKIPIRDAEGNIIGILGTSEDITEQKLAEQALRTSEAKFRVLAESAPAAIVIVQGQKIVYANPFATELSGYNINDLLRLPYTELIHPDYHEMILTRARTILEGKILKEAEVVKLLTKKGKVKWISLSGKQVEHGGNPAILAIILDITRLIQVEEELRRSQSRLANAMDIARLGYWEYDVDKDTFTFDDHFYSIFHTSAEKVGGYTLSSARYTELFVHPEDMDVVGTETRKAIETTDPNYSRQLEHRMIFADGQTGYILVRFYIVKDDKGRTIKTYGANQDITERKQTEIALEESEVMLRSILRTVSVGIGVVKNRVFEWSNETYQKITGYSENELKGKSTRMVYPDDEEFKRAGLMYDLMKKHGVGSVEAKHKHKNGNIIDVLISVAPIVPGDLNSGVAFTLLDITDEKKAADALKRSEEKFRLLASLLPAGIFQTDNSGNTIYVNDRWVEISGISAKEAKKGKWLDAIHPEDRSMVYDKWQSFIKGESDYRLECRFLNKNKQVRWIYGEAISEMNIIGTKTGYIGIVIDITDRKKIEDELYISLEKYRVLFESFPLGITITDKSGQIMEANLESERLLGISSDEHKRRLYDSAKWKIIQTDGTPMPSDEYASVRALKTNRKVENVEMGIVKDKGEITWINVTAAPIPLENYGVAITYNDISSHKKAEEELQISEARFRAFMENLSVMTYMKNKEGEFIYGNKTILRFAGRTSEKYNGARVTELLPEDLGRWMEQMDKKVLKTMKPVDLGEWKWVKDNRERWFSEFKFPISLPDGETIIGGWMMEVTLRKTTELALKESEARYKDLVEKAGIAIMTDDADGNITYFNREFARIFGYTKAEMKKQSWETLIHTGDLKKKISYHKKRMKGENSPNSYELRGIQKNGNEIWLQFEITVLTEQDKIIGTRNYMWDVTDRKKILEAIENSESRFRELFNNMSSGVAVYLFDPAKKDFLFTDINRAGMRISQVKNKKDVLNRYLLECFPGAKDLGLWNALIRVRKSGIPEKLQNTHYKDDRLDQYVENFVYMLKTGELVAVYDDISERVLGEQNILRSYEEIRKLSQHLETIREEERKQIATELHDELGQILTAIKMDVSWIRDKMPPERKGIKKRTGSTIEIINEAIRSVQRLSMELRPRMLDDLGLMETLKAFFSEYEKWAKISINYDLPQKEPDLIPGQEISVFRIIQESLTNIARHAGATEVKLIIKERNDNLDLKIQDNGIGIPDEKVHSSESFGILNMRERIQGWGGTFEIKGITGKGTTITARLPVGKVKS